MVYTCSSSYSGVEAGESLEPGRRSWQWAEIVPLHFSPGNRVRLRLKNKTKQTNKKISTLVTSCAFSVLVRKASAHPEKVQISTRYTGILQHRAVQWSLYASFHKAWLLLLEFLGAVWALVTGCSGHRLIIAHRWLERWQRAVARRYDILIMFLVLFSPFEFPDEFVVQI